MKTSIKWRRALLWLCVLSIWGISPVLVTQEAIGNGRFFYSPDGKYKIQALTPGPWTPWALWQLLRYDCVMFIKLYDHKTGELLGQSSWFRFINCHDLWGMVIWPGELRSNNRFFSIGDPEVSAYMGARINIQ